MGRKVCHEENVSACKALYKNSQSVSAAGWPKDLMGEVQKTMGVESVAPRAPELKVKMDSKLAEKNFLFLSNHHLDLSKALLAPNGSTATPVGVLKLLFWYHPNWCRMENSLKEGP